MIAHSKIDINGLVELLQKRDNQGFSILYDRYSTALYGIIFKIVKDEEEAENLLQDTFVKIWKNIEKFQPEKGTLFTWMLNIARNTALDFLRSKGFSQQAKNQELENSVHTQITFSENINIETIGLLDLVKRLEPMYQQAIELVYLNGYTHEEAAEKLTIPLGTLKTRVRIGIRELKKMI
jgi:RNA polymerase sigma-70 factor, ECF subfamily